MSYHTVHQYSTSEGKSYCFAGKNWAENAENFFQKKFENKPNVSFLYNGDMQVSTYSMQLLDKEFKVYRIKPKHEIEDDRIERERDNEIERERERDEEIRYKNH